MEVWRRYDRKSQRKTPEHARLGVCQDVPFVYWPSLQQQPALWVETLPVWNPGGYLWNRIERQAVMVGAAS
jgi:hypothetical protein